MVVRSDNAVFRARRAGTSIPVEDKTDYSPVDEAAPEAQKRRERRLWAPFALGAWSFLVYAAVLAGIILLVIYLTGGFGEGAE